MNTADQVDGIEITYLDPNTWGPFSVTALQPIVYLSKAQMLERYPVPTDVPA